MINEKDFFALRESMRKAREENHLTQESIAEQLGVSVTHIKHLESGHRKPSLETLFGIAHLLNLSLDAVLFPETELSRSNVRGKINRLLDGCDEDELKFFLTVLESYPKKNKTY